MSVKKLLGTGACMVIIGVSAGASYGLFQRLTDQVATPAVAQSVAASELAPASKIANSQFVAASVTTWTPPEQSEVTPPVLIKPAAFTQPEPPLLQYTTIQTDDAARMSPDLPLFAHIDDAIVVDDTPSTSVASVKRKPQAREIAVAAAPLGIVAPGTLRRFRGQGETETKGASNSDQDGIFEQQFPPRTALQPLQPRRPTAAASSRAAQRIDRIRKVWSTGVYR
ncbi:hypothetical protein [Litoreibacter janthinus]|uniref:Uncharacterized protein n=1 Tax=Litoreibacter janthinus TaxID=670154 RepID=A0A1I6IDW2_9RHOB|nr:hypothetical protein [Litoreibacter janthinus]SFR64955.1 hypothetical protein SAMN04488002_3729 [Litoreibacter janthinus]